MDDTRLSILLNEREVEAAYKLSLPWLRAARVRGGGPPFVKVGRKVLYRRADIEKFVEERLTQSTSEAVR